jgi:ribonucleoside-triphosphate reductase
LRKQGYHVEPLIAYREVVSDDGVKSYETYDNLDTSVVSFPVCSGDNVRTEESVSMWEQLNLAAFLQKYWADNQVSCTVSFDPEREGPQIPHALNYFQYMLKGISFLPRLNYNSIYKQAPYEEIDEQTYHYMMVLVNAPLTGEESPINDRVRLLNCFDTNFTHKKI